MLWLFLSFRWKWMWPISFSGVVDPYQYFIYVGLSVFYVVHITLNKKYNTNAYHTSNSRTWRWPSCSNYMFVASCLSVHSYKFQVNEKYIKKRTHWTLPLLKNNFSFPINNRSADVRKDEGKLVTVKTVVGNSPPYLQNIPESLRFTGQQVWTSSSFSVLSSVNAHIFNLCKIYVHINITM
jgi:hypothetical protein